MHAFFSYPPYYTTSTALYLLNEAKLFKKNRPTNRSPRLT